MLCAIPCLILATCTSCTVSSKYWNPLISIFPVSYITSVVFRHAEFGTDLWLERSSEYFWKKLKHIWKCMYMQNHGKRFPERTKYGWGGPWQRNLGNGIGWGWQGHLGADFSSCCWNHYSCFSSQSWDLGVLWASLSASIFEFVWGITGFCSWPSDLTLQRLIPTCGYLKIIFQKHTS